MTITCGLNYSSGDAVVAMDADLQDPPEFIPELVKKWREGYDVVYAVREHRQGDSVFKRATAAVFTVSFASWHGSRSRPTPGISGCSAGALSKH